MTPHAMHLWFWSAWLASLYGMAWTTAKLARV
jgi:hypothetical protein